MTRKILLALGLLVSIWVPFFGSSAAAASNPPVLISEVQTGFIAGDGVEYPKQEFIELVNVSSDEIDMTGWQLEYLSAAHDGSGAPTAVLAIVDGILPAGSWALFSYSGYMPAPVDGMFGQGSTASSGLLAKTAGHVRLTAGDTMVDCVAWGSSAVAIEGCDKIAAVAPAGHTIQRSPGEDGFYDKALGVKNLAPPTPQGGQLQPPSLPNPDPEEELPPEEQEPGLPACSSVILSEVLPNPAGSDAAGEFIELYNTSSQTVSLSGCILRLGSSGKSFGFPEDIIMTPHEYRAFGYAVTGLQLLNEGSELWLIADSQQTSLAYPSSTDDQAWALIDGTWQITLQPTPNAPNVLLLPAGKGAKASEAAKSGLEDCPAGKFRNPETNRCKNIEAASNEPAPCAPGQERNPQTNRCRKVAAARTSNNADTQAAKTNQNYKILLGVLVLIFGYIAYEYRNDARNGLRRLRHAVTDRGRNKSKKPYR